MRNHQLSSAWRATALMTALWLQACSGDEATSAAPAEAAPPFKSLAAAANAPESFTEPRAGVPLQAEAVAFIALDESMSDADMAESGPRAAVFLQESASAAPRALFSDEALVSPLDIEASRDGETLFVADYAGGSEGTGVIWMVPVAGGQATAAAEGWSPRSVTLGDGDRLYFSGIDPELGEPGVFRLSAGSVEPVFVGAPLVDPSGIAVFADGRVLVADTRLFDGQAGADAVGSEAGVVIVEDGRAEIFATGFATGFPAGIALTLDESTLIISGQGPDRSDTVYLFGTNDPSAPPLVVTDVFSAWQDSSGGLKRAHGSNTFIWASLAANGGTVFRIEG